jgi:hypothetical protein
MSEKRVHEQHSGNENHSVSDTGTGSANSFHEPDLFDHAWKRFSHFLRRPITDTWHVPVAALLLSLCFGALLALSPAVYVNHHVWDLFVPIDGAWRMSNGQWPHTDFATPIGIVYYLLLGAATSLAGSGAKVIIWSQLLFLPITFLLAFTTSRNRLPGFLRLLFLLFIGLLTISPRSLDYPGTLNFTANYNRFSWALTCIILVSAYIEPIKRSRQQALTETLALGLTLLLLFFLKISFFLVACCLLFVAMVGSKVNQRVAFGSLSVGCAAIGACFVAGDTPWLYYADLQDVAATAARQGGLLRTSRLVEMAYMNLARIVGFTAFLMWLIRTSRDKDEQKEASRATLLIAAAMALLYGATIQVHDRNILGLAVLGMCCLQILHARRRQRRTQTEKRDFDLVGLCAAALIAWPTLLDGSAIIQHYVSARADHLSKPWSSDPSSPLFAIRFRQSTPQEIEQMAACDDKAGLSRQKTSRIPCETTWHLLVPLVTEDALALLERHQADKSRIASLTFSPMFPWLLGQPPPRGLHAWYDHGRTFDEITFEQNPEVLADSEFVLVPNSATNIVLRLPFDHDHVLQERFKPIEQTLHWELWGRRN